MSQVGHAPDAATVRRRRVVLSLGAVGISELVNKLAPLLILYFANLRLGVAAFGRAQHVLATCESLIPLVVFGVNALTVTELSASDRSDATTRRLVSTALWLKIYNFLAVVLISVVALTSESAETRALYLAAGILLLGACLDTDFVHYSTQTLAARNVFSVVAKLVSVVGVALWVRSPDDVVAYAALAAVPSLLLAALSGVYNFRRHAFEWVQPALVARTFRLAVPFGISHFLSTFADRYDILLVEHWFGDAATGFYSGQVRVTQSVSTLAAAVGLVFYAEMAAERQREPFSRSAEVSLWSMLAFVAPTAVGVWFVDGPLLELIYGPDYVPHRRVFDLLTVGCLFQVAIQVFGIQVLFLRGRAWAYCWAMLGSLAVGAAAAAALSPGWGIAGVALGQVVGKAVGAVAVYLAARRELDGPSPSVLVRTIGPALGMGACLWLMPATGLWTTLAAGVSSYALIFAAVNAATIRQVLRRRK